MYASLRQRDIREGVGEGTWGKGVGGGGGRFKKRGAIRYGISMFKALTANGLIEAPELRFAVKHTKLVVNKCIC